MVEIDFDDFQLRAYMNGNKWTVRLILQGEKAYELLKQNTFSNPVKDLRRQVMLDERHGQEMYNMR